MDPVASHRSTPLQPTDPVCTPENPAPTETLQSASKEVVECVPEHWGMTPLLAPPKPRGQAPLDANQLREWPAAALDQQSTSLRRKLSTNTSYADRANDERSLVAIENEARRRNSSASRPHATSPDAAMAQALGGLIAAGATFVGRYLEMREANTIGADKYFHCMANCEASVTEEGRWGAELLSEAREITDEHLKGDPREACDADRAANEQGRAAEGRDCLAACDSLRPPALPARY